MALVAFIGRVEFTIAVDRAYRTHVALAYTDSQRNITTGTARAGYSQSFAEPEWVARVRTVLFVSHVCVPELI